MKIARSERLVRMFGELIIVCQFVTVRYVAVEIFNRYINLFSGQIIKHEYMQFQRKENRVKMYDS